jgi:hypothetical protein
MARPSDTRSKRTQIGNARQGRLNRHRASACTLIAFDMLTLAAACPQVFVEDRRVRHDQI